MKYRCLIFDHDDTIVNSSATIHYPCFVEFMQKFHPDQYYSLEDFMRYHFEVGFVSFYKDICGFSDGELDFEHRYWLEYTKNHCAEAFPGIREIMEDHKAQGGKLAVVSHSDSVNIEKDFKYNDLPDPDIILGYDTSECEIKPSPMPVVRIMERFRLKPEEVLVIDDMKPGYLMAKAAGVSFAAAGWCFDIPANTAFMQENADFYCRRVRDLAKLL